MFRKLRLTLTLTNVLVVSFIFLAFVSGIFILMSKITNDQTNQLLNLVSSQAGLSTPPNLHDHRGHEGHQYRYFYVKLNSIGKIVSSSQGIDLTDKHMNDLIKKTYVSPKNRGTIEAEDDEYRFVKGSSKNSSETTIVFVNTHPEHDMLEELLVVLIISGLSGLVLVFLGGLFMANRALIPITESWNRQRDFVADASHELRTPLSVIETTLDLIINKKNQTIESQMKWLDNIHTENKRMTRLVNDLLLLARADSEQLTLEMNTFSLHSALLEAYIPFEAPAIKKGIHLKPFESLQIEFFGDETRIKQLAVILIDNALKHTNEGGTVSMALIDAGDNMEIVVKDTGEGIEKEHLDKIFRRFYRVDKSRSRKDGSVGLGLSIAEWIVKEHHGYIKVESTKGFGTTFHVILPKS